MATFTLTSDLCLNALDPAPPIQVARGDRGERTIYVATDQFLPILSASCAAVSKNPSELPSSFDFQGSVLVSGDERIECRGHAALCADQFAYSVTLRSRDIKKFGGPCLLEPHLATKRVETSSGVVYGALTGGQDAPIRDNALLLIAGVTGSGKTTLLNDLVTLHLAASLRDLDVGRTDVAGLPQTPVERVRPPHVVVIGDPVETRFFCPETKTLAESVAFQRSDRPRPFDFTPRIVGRDVPELGIALLEALRQTPAAVVVNEMRTPADYRHVWRFAATGHLVFATCHARSLKEVFGTLLAVSGSRPTAGDRAALVRRLAGVVHVEKYSEALYVPTLWRPTSRGRQDFVSDGLSSLVPASPRSGTDETTGVLGRLWMLQRFHDHRPGVGASEFKRALVSDLSGV